VILIILRVIACTLTSIAMGYLLGFSREVILSTILLSILLASVITEVLKAKCP